MTELDALLLQKSHRLFLSTGEPKQDVRALETDLLGLGYSLAKDLRDALAALPVDELKQTGTWIFETLAQPLGGHRPFVPLFRNFPQSTPRDTHALWVERVLVWLHQQPNQPCVLCGTVGSVHAVKPCAHLVCRKCFDGSDYSACPICRERIDVNDPFLLPRAADPASTSYVRFHGAMTLLSLGRDRDAAAREYFQRLVRRGTVLRPDESYQLHIFAAEYDRRLVDWLPKRIPVKETMATLFGTLIHYADADILQPLSQHLRTATDVLRVLVAHFGGNPDLTEKKVPVRAMPRRLRRAVLKVLDGFSPQNLAEDLRRHPGKWKLMASLIHPFEREKQHPNAAAAFRHLVRKDTGFRSWASHVEAALANKDVSSALPWLEERPGEFMRRLDFVLRSGDPAEVERSVEKIVGKANSPLLLMVSSHLKKRHQPFAKRVFFPRGEAAHAFGRPDERPLLAGDTIGPIVRRLDEELLRRARKLPPFPQAILDERLQDLLVPYSEKTASRALVQVPRGSVLPIPEGQRLRFFVHWMEPPEQRVDLDLSIAFYDEKWWLTDLCDFTQMRLDDESAIHSGDVTSGPPPLGGAEFLDVDLEKLTARGVRWAVPVVFSYNSVSFDRMQEAFAGFMQIGEDPPEHFDARAVEQRFDLSGKAKIALPLLIDVKARSFRWIDVKIPPEGQFHSVRGSRGPIACIGKDTTLYFGTGARPTMWDLACLHAARCRAVYVRRRDGRLQRADDLKVLRDDDPGIEKIPDAPSFFAGLDDAEIPENSEGYALRFRRSDAGKVRRLGAGDLLTLLKP